ncbi:MAG: protein kinase, partial [Myxococcales bacterium]|nr:protein kinase [Myxococcales bacterium]
MPFRFSEHGNEFEVPIDPEELLAAMAEEGLDLPDGDDAKPVQPQAPVERPRGPWQSLQAAIIQREAARVLDPENNPRVKIDHFELLEKIGNGAMGVVFRALDPRMGRTVALKLWSEKLPTVESGGPDPLEEVRALAKLTHPNVVSIYDIGEYEGCLYLVLEDVQGLDADRWAPASWQHVLFVYIRVGRGLAAAHAAGILHNDVKPSNVLLGHDQRVKVSDFGLAASMTTGRDKLCGTVLYMAPDTIRGPASDQFSLCVSIYESLYGSLPFIAKSFVGIVEAIDNGEFQVGSSPLPGIPDRLRAAVLRGLSLDPADRHASVADLVTELEQCLADGAEPPAGADGGESAEGGEAASQQTENERPQAPTSEHRASRQSEPKPRGLRNLGPAVIAL